MKKEAADEKEDDRLVDEFEVEEEEERYPLARPKDHGGAQAQAAQVNRLPIVEADEAPSILKAEVKCETRAEEVEDEAELVVDAYLDGGGAQVDKDNIGVTEAAKTEVEGEKLLEIEDEVVERGTEHVAVEEDHDSEVELVMEGCPDEDQLETKQAFCETLAKQGEVVDTESEVEDDAVEVTGDLDYDFVDPEQDGFETETVPSEASPVSEAGINVEAEILEEELDAGEEKEVVVSKLAGGLVGQVQEDEEVILLPDEIHDHTEEVKGPSDDVTPQIKQDFDEQINEGQDKSMVDLEDVGVEESSKDELYMVLEQPVVEPLHVAAGGDALSKQAVDMHSPVTHENGAAVSEEPVPNDHHDAEQDEVQLVDQDPDEVQLVEQDADEVQLVEEDGVQLAELEQVVPEDEVAAQEQELVEVQIAEQEEVFSPDLADRETSPAVTVVSDSEPEVILTFH